MIPEKGANEPGKFSEEEMLQTGAVTSAVMEEAPLQFFFRSLILYLFLSAFETEVKGCWH